MAIAVAQPVEFLREQVRSGLEHSYVELTAGDMLLSAMNEAEKCYVMELAQQSDRAALAVVFRSLLADLEQGAKFLNLPRRVRVALIKAIYGEANDLAIRSVMMKADMVEASLLSEASASPLERLLIERVATCWLAVELADMEASGQDAEARPMLAPTKTTEYFAKRQDRAHKRFLQATNALVQMRRLMSPIPFVAGQVNIATAGGQQVNVTR